MPSKKRTFAKSIERLETIINEMENLEIPLEMALKLYKEGMELSMECKDTLNKVEKEVIELIRNSGGTISEIAFSTNL